MAALWMSVFKQLLYPALFAYYRTGNEGALAAQSVFSVTLVVVTFTLLVSHTRFERLLDERLETVIAAVAATGIAGSAGIALRAFYDIAEAGGVAAVCVGSALSVIYLPIHFAFWAFYAHRPHGLGAVRPVAFSFLLFVAAYLLLTVADANTVWASIVCPVVSAAMAFVCSYDDTTDERFAHSNAEEGKPDDTIASATRAPSAAPLPSATPALAPSATESATSPHEVFPPNGLPAGFAEAFDLSEREAELAAYARRNYSARKIAGELFIAESTVYTHLKRIYRKTDVHSKHELIELIDSWERE